LASALALVAACAPASLSRQTAIDQALEVRVEPYAYEYRETIVKGQLMHLRVPQRYKRPDGPQIEIAFVRLKSIAEHPGPPVIYLAGGPGGSAIDLAKGPRGRSFLKMREVADIILLDQRGVGLSIPNLTCEEHLRAPLVVTRAEAMRAVNEAAESCARHWREKNVDLTAYNVVESAHDVDAVRRALGVEKIILWGSSYGTQLGFAVIRHHGDAVERAVFSGVEGPDHTLKLPSIVERQLMTLEGLIAADAQLSVRYPNLLETARRVLEVAVREPFQVTVEREEAWAPQTMPLGRFDLEQIVAGMIGTRSQLALLPAVLTSFDQGDMNSPYVQAVAAQALAARSSAIGSAMAYATDCSSGASPARRSRIEREAQDALVHDLNFPLPDVCAAWGVPELPASERAAVRSSVPVLFLSGTLDGQTPVQNTEDVASGFPNSIQVLIEGSGHGNDLFVSAPEIEEITAAFMRTGQASTRRITLPPLEIQ
jgi:pimeloyl-ACP methyl ester carboxylesterase